MCDIFALFDLGHKMNPIVAYLIIIVLQAFASWEWVRRLWAESKVRGSGMDGAIIFMLIVVGIFIVASFNWILYSGGFYRFPWTW